MPFTRTTYTCWRKKSEIWLTCQMHCIFNSTFKYEIHKDTIPFGLGFHPLSLRSITRINRWIHIIRPQLSQWICALVYQPNTKKHNVYSCVSRYTSTTSAYKNSHNRLQSRIEGRKINKDIQHHKELCDKLLFVLKLQFVERNLFTEPKEKVFGLSATVITLLY